MIPKVDPGLMMPTPHWNFFVWFDVGNFDCITHISFNCSQQAMFAMSISFCRHRACVKRHYYNPLTLRIWLCLWFWNPWIRYGYSRSTYGLFVMIKRNMLCLAITRFVIYVDKSWKNNFVCTSIHVHVH